MTYIEDVAQILAEMKLCTDQMQEQTEEALVTLDKLEVPKLNMGIVTLERWVGEAAFFLPENVFKVMENGRKIGSLQIIKDAFGTLQFRVDIFERTIYSRTMRDREPIEEIEKELTRVFDYFGLVPTLPTL